MTRLLSRICVLFFVCFSFKVRQVHGQPFYEGFQNHEAFLADSRPKNCDDLEPEVPIPYYDRSGFVGNGGEEQRHVPLNLNSTCLKKTIYTIHVSTACTISLEFLYLQFNLPQFEGLQILNNITTVARIQKSCYEQWSLDKLSKNLTKNLTSNNLTLIMVALKSHPVFKLRYISNGFCSVDQQGMMTPMNLQKTMNPRDRGGHHVLRHRSDDRVLLLSVSISLIAILLSFGLLILFITRQIFFPRRSRTSGSVPNQTTEEAVQMEHPLPPPSYNSVTADPPSYASVMSNSSQSLLCGSEWASGALSNEMLARGREENADCTWHEVDINDNIPMISNAAPF